MIASLSIIKMIVFHRRDTRELPERILNRSSAIEPGRHDRNLHFALPHLIIGNSTKDHLGIRIDILGYDIRRFVDLEHGHIARSGNIEEHALGAVNRQIEKRTVDRRFRRLNRPIIPGSNTDTHKSAPAVFHNGAHIGKVDIHDTGLRYEIRNSLHALPKHIVYNTKRIDECRLAIDNRKEFVIRNSNERIHALLHIPERFFGDSASLSTLKGKGFCYNTNRERANFFGGLCHNRRSATPRAATQTASHKHHVSAFQNLLNFIAVFFRRLTTNFRVHTGAETLGKVLADMNLLARTRMVERLCIGIYDDKLNTFDFCLNHPGNGIASRPANPNHLYLCKCFNCRFDFSHTTRE